MQLKKRTIRFGLMLSAASMAAAVSYAAPPPAGSKIGNQASATYVNASGDTVSVTSNRVETTVQQVAGVTLQADNSKSTAPGGKVFLPHTVTNDGNGPDFFTLTAVDGGTGPYDFTAITIFPDANFDGVADSTTAITQTPVLEQGASFGFVIEATVPGGAGSGTSETIDVEATSDFSQTNAPLTSDTDTDTVTVSTGPVTEVVKSMTVADTVADGVIGPGDTVTVTLTYSSSGFDDADDLIITDQLSQYLTYVAGSGRWSDTGSSVAMTDGEDAIGTVEPGSPLGFEQENGGGYQIAYEYNGTDTVEFEIDRVPSGRTASVTFEATIDADAPAGELTNQATQTVGGVAFPPSNTASFTIAPTYRVTAADAAATSHNGDPDAAGNLDAGNASATDDDSTLNDIVEEDSDIYQGGTVTMEFVVTNNANVTDTIDLSVANDGSNGFPAGTTFSLVGADGATPVAGPIGPIAAGAFQRVNIIARLPADVAPVAAASSNYEVILTAQSTNGGTANTATGLFTGAILASSVDITNRDFVAPGDEGDGPGNATPLLTETTDPGQPVTFPFVIANDGVAANTYDLTMQQALPAGWSFEFRLTDGTPISNTGVIRAGETKEIVAIVTPPSTAAPGNTDIQVTVTSPTSGQSDTITNTISVNQVIDIAFTADQSIQLAPGGIGSVLHTLQNLGNVTITEGGISAAGDFSAFTGTLFYDVNEDGAADSGDIVIDNIIDIAGGIAPGASVQLIYRVQAPANGAAGLSETETLTLEASLNAVSDVAAGTVTDRDTSNNAVLDTASVVSGDLTLNKKQGIDADCDGSAVSFVTTGLDAKPGECIRYRIEALNQGSASATSVTIKDTIPSFTTLTECTASACAIAVTPAGTSAISQQPAEGATGNLVTTHGDLLPGQSASMEFTVKIDE
jgi:uncharacterized repeat protein (TIGR01451 family)